MKYYRTEVNKRWWGEDTINVPYHHIEEGITIWEPIEPDFNIEDINTITIRTTIEKINNLSYIKQTDDSGLNVAYFHFGAYSKPMNMDDGQITWEATFIRDQWMCHLLFRFRSLMVENVLVKPLMGMKNRVIKRGDDYVIDFKEQRYLERVDTNNIPEPHPIHDTALENAINALPLDASIRVGYTEGKKAGHTIVNAIQGITLVDSTTTLNDAFFFNKYTNRYRYILAKSIALAQPNDDGSLNDDRKINICDLNGVSTIVDINDNFFLLIPCPNDDTIENWNKKYASVKGILGNQTIVTYLDWEISPSQISALYSKRVITNLNIKTDDKRVICSSYLAGTKFYSTLVNGDCFLIDNRQVEFDVEQPIMIKELNRICDEFSEGNLPTTRANEPSMYNSSFAYHEWSLTPNNMPKITADMLQFSDNPATQSKLSLRIVPTDVVSYCWNMSNPNPKYRFTENNDALYFGDEKKVVYFTETYQDWLQTNSTTEQMGRANIADTYQQSINDANAQAKSTNQGFGNWMSTIVGAFTGSTWVKMGQRDTAKQNAYENAETQRRMATRELDSMLANVKRTPNSINIPSYKSALFNRFSEFVGKINFNLYQPLEEDADEQFTIRHWFGYVLKQKQPFRDFLNRVHRNFIKLDPSFNTDKLMLASIKHLPVEALQYKQPEFNQEFLDRFQQGFQLQNIYHTEEPYGIDDEKNWEIHGTHVLQSIDISSSTDVNVFVALSNWSTAITITRKLTPPDATYVGYKYNNDNIPNGLTYDVNGINGTFANEQLHDFNIYDSTDVPAIKSNVLTYKYQNHLTQQGDWSDWTPQAGQTTSRNFGLLQVNIDVHPIMTATGVTPVDWIQIINTGRVITINVNNTTTRPAGTYVINFTIHTDGNTLTRTLSIIIVANIVEFLIGNTWTPKINPNWNVNGNKQLQTTDIGGIRFGGVQLTQNELNTFKVVPYDAYHPQELIPNWFSFTQNTPTTMTIINNVNSYMTYTQNITQWQYIFQRNGQQTVSEPVELSDSLAMAGNYFNGSHVITPIIDIGALTDYRWQRNNTQLVLLGAFSNDVGINDGNSDGTGVVNIVDFMTGKVTTPSVVSNKSGNDWVLTFNDLPVPAGFMIGGLLNGFTDDSGYIYGMCVNIGTNVISAPTMRKKTLKEWKLMRKTN